jgi:hypothetical protein
MRKILKFFGVALLLGGLGFGVLFAVSPAEMPVPGRDAGLFLYTGQQILHGAIPYRDFWDNKGPAVFYLNALGLLLGGGSDWGVWGLQLALFWGGAWLGFLALRRFTGDGPAVLGSAAWMLGTLDVLEGGNFTEDYALPLIFATLFSYFMAREGRRPVLWGTLIGICGAFLFLLRPNLIAVTIASGFLLLFEGIKVPAQRREALRALTAAVAAGLVILALMVGYLAAHGAASDFYDCVFHYNFIYSGGMTLVARFSFLAMGFSRLLGLNLCLLTLWVLVILLLPSLRSELKPATPLLWFFLLWAPMELAFSTISGRIYLHYYLTWLAPVGVGLSLVVFVWEKLARQAAKAITGPNRRPWRGAALAVMCLLPLAPAWSHFGRLLNRAWTEVTLHGVTTRDIQLWELQTTRGNAALDFIRRHTPAGQTLLVWGSEAQLNFASGLRAPDRFVHQYPLLTVGYVRPEYLETFLRDLQTAPPALIIDTSSTNAIVPPLIDPIQRWESPNPKYAEPVGMERLRVFVRERYSDEGPILRTGRWRAFVLRRNLPSQNLDRPAAP